MIKKILKMSAFILTCGLLCTACVSTKNDITAETTDADCPKVRLTLENGKTIDMELYPNIAPKSVELFLKGVETEYYAGKVFHRAISGFMIQGGSKSGTGIGGMDEAIEGEFSSNGFNNTLKHTRGVVSLARTMDPNSASGQFFIMHEDYPSLDGQYAAFGKVIDGMDVVDEIAEMPTGGMRGDELIEKPVIESIVILENN